jgi:hypothetical protein
MIKQIRPKPKQAEIKGYLFGSSIDDLIEYHLQRIDATILCGIVANRMGALLKSHPGGEKLWKVLRKVIEEKMRN